MTKEADGYYLQNVSRAEGDYDVRVKKAEAEANSIEILVEQCKVEGGLEVLTMRLTQD